MISNDDIVYCICLFFHGGLFAAIIIRLMGYLDKSNRKVLLIDILASIILFIPTVFISGLVCKRIDFQLICGFALVIGLVFFLRLGRYVDQYVMAHED